MSALEDLWKAAPDAKVEDLDAAEVRGGGRGFLSKVSLKPAGAGVGQSLRGVRGGWV